MGATAGIAEAVEFLHAAMDAELRAERAMLVEPNDKKVIEVIREYDAMFADEMGGSSGLSRPLGRPPAHFKKPERVEAAARRKARTVFAVARYEHRPSDLYRGWIGHSELGPHGDGIYQSLYFTKQSGALAIVSQYTVCIACVGAMTLPDGKKCPSCKGSGWFLARGPAFKKLGGVRELRKLKAPSDARWKRAYDAIAEPD